MFKVCSIDHSFYGKRRRVVYIRIFNQQKKGLNDDAVELVRVVVGNSFPRYAEVCSVNSHLISFHSLTLVI